MKTEMTTRSSQQFSWLVIAFLCVLITQITGCANVPEGSPAMQQQALSFTPPAGKTGVYVIRPSKITAEGFLVDSNRWYNDFPHSGGNVRYEINLDYQESGSLLENSYLFGVLPPGEHTLRCYIPYLSSELSSEMVHFTAEAGKNYYFLAHYHAKKPLLGSLIYTLVIDPISETDGQAYVRQFKLSGDNRFEFQN